MNWKEGEREREEKMEQPKKEWAQSDKTLKAFRCR